MNISEKKMVWYKHLVMLMAIVNTYFTAGDAYSWEDQRLLLLILLNVEALSAFDDPEKGEGVTLLRKKKKMCPSHPTKLQQNFPTAAPFTWFDNLREPVGVLSFHSASLALETYPQDKLNVASFLCHFWYHKFPLVTHLLYFSPF